MNVKSIFQLLYYLVMISQEGKTTISYGLWSKHRIIAFTHCGLIILPESKRGRDLAFKHTYALDHLLHL